MLRTLEFESAETGQKVQIPVDLNDSNLIKLKSLVSLFVSIDPDDQIILVGPPYKMLDSQMYPSIFINSSSSTRIFLYNRLTFSTSPVDDKLRLSSKLESKIKPLFVDKVEKITGFF